MLLFAPPALPLRVPAPPGVQGQAPKPSGPRVTFDEAAIALLVAYDADRPLPPVPNLATSGRPAYRWLRACALAKAGHPPENPFAAGPARAEAEAFRALIALPAAEAATRLPRLQVKELGTWMGLWRWGKAQVRTGAWDRAQRRAWEDRLLTGRGLDLV
ncbi:MAG TPA: hypothetical protein VJ570_05210, partial [Holophagaceae bacterium]|nr:hypothetical protein [Holophagaceae bacterium]